MRDPKLPRNCSVEFSAEGLEGQLFMWASLQWEKGSGSVFAQQMLWHPWMSRRALVGK